MTAVTASKEGLSPLSSALERGQSLPRIAQNWGPRLPFDPMKFQLANSGYAFSRTNATVNTTPTSENPIATRYASVQGATDVLSFKIWSKR